MRSRTKQTTQQLVVKVSGIDNDIFKQGDSDVVKKANQVRNKLAKDDKIPREYTEIKNEIKARFGDFAYKYIPRLYNTLRKNGFDTLTAKLTVIADGMAFGWKYNTIRKSIPSEAKNPNKAIGAREAAKSRNKKKESRQKQYNVEKGNGKDTNHVEDIPTSTITEALSQKLTFLLTRENVNEISEKSEQSLQTNGNGDVKVQFEDSKLVNVSAFK